VSSLGSLAASAFFAAIALISIGFLMGMISLGCGVIRDSLATALENLELSRGVLDVENLTVLSDNRSVEARILNRGADPIRVGEFDKMDVILVYRSSAGFVKAVWLPYDPDMDLSYGWRPLNITYEGSEELLNPVSPDMSSGLWDPDECLAIRAWVADEIRGAVKLIVAAPSGVSSP